MIRDGLQLTRFISPCNIKQRSWIDGTYRRDHSTVQLRPDQVRVGVARFREDGVSLELLRQRVRHLLRHRRSGIQLVPQHMRRADSVLKPVTKQSVNWPFAARRERSLPTSPGLQLHVVLLLQRGIGQSSRRSRRGWRGDGSDVYFPLPPSRAATAHTLRAGTAGRRLLNSGGRPDSEASSDATKMSTA